ncbi:MAG: hypothetical protein NTX42_06155 [Methanothrix sp.]|nr:hypothetical protein [Methanothrix sp.]
MKRVIVILLMILAAADLLSAAAAFGKSDSMGIIGQDGPAFFTPGTDTKKVEDKMAEALARLDSWKKAHAEEKNPGNSTLDNISINNSLNNSSLQNSSAANVSGANELGANEFDTNSLAGRQNVGSSSKASFNGYYGMTATRHEIGKSGIKSKMFLSGNFEMDKTVKFQDQGVD